MYFAPNPGILAAGVSTGKTYAEYQARLAALATYGVIDWSGIARDGRFRTTAAAPTGYMYGSPWTGFFWRTNSTVARVIQHCMPSEAAFNALVAGGYEVFWQDVDPWGEGFLTGISRNGYSSSSWEEDERPRGRPDLFIYWDGSRAMQVNPSAGTGPTPYDW